MMINRKRLLKETYKHTKSQRLQQLLQKLLRQISFGLQKIITKITIKQKGVNHTAIVTSNVFSLIPILANLWENLYFCRSNERSHSSNEGRQILLFAIPMLIGNVFQQLYNIVDSIVVGKYIGF